MHIMLCEFYLVWLGLSPSPWPRYICIAAQTCWFKVVCGRKKGKHGKMGECMEIGGKMELQSEIPASCIKM